MPKLKKIVNSVRCLFVKKSKYDFVVDTQLSHKLLFGIYETNLSICLSFYI